MAIEDAVVLARQLSRTPDPATALRSFTEERRARTAAITRQSWMAGRIAQADNPLLCAIRDSALGLLGAVAPPKRLFAAALFDVGPL